MRKLIYLNTLLLILLLPGCTNSREILKAREISGIPATQEISEAQEVSKSHDIEAPESEQEESAGQDNENKQDNADSASDQINVSDSITECVDLYSQFKGLNGCAVVYDVKENKYSVYNKPMSEQQASPYSTFKIVSTLAGLKNGIIESETSTMSYTGEQYPISEWNENLTLEKAFQTSCIWFFRQIIDEAGNDEIQSELTQLEYGNCDISEWDGSNVNPLPELNGFWIDSSLKISPLEQVQVLKKIFEGESIYSDEDVAILKKIMAVGGDRKSIYGKTGSGLGGEAWFVGFAEENGERVYFAVYLNDDAQQNNISGNVAKEIAFDILG